MNYAYNKRRRDARRGKKLAGTQLLPGMYPDVAEVMEQINRGFQNKEAFLENNRGHFERFKQEQKSDPVPALPKMAQPRPGEIVDVPRGHILNDDVREAQAARHRRMLVETTLRDAIEAADSLSGSLCSSRVGMCGEAVYKPGSYIKKAADDKREKILKAVRLLEMGALVGDSDSERQKLLILLLEIRAAAGIGWEVDAADLPHAIAQKIAGGGR